MDKLRLTVSIAINNLMARKLRSFLTILGIIIGVAAVVTIVSIGRSSSKSMMAALESSGTNGVYVMPGNSGGGRVRGPAARVLKLTDATAIQRECPSVLATTPIMLGNMQVVYSGNNWNAPIYGTNESYPQIMTWPTKQGSFFSAHEIRRSEALCVLGTTVAVELFGMRDPVGESVRIGTNPFTVIGVLESKGSSGGQDQDNLIVIPYTAYIQKVRNVDYASMIMCTAVSQEATVDAKNEITSLLRQRHRIGDNKEDDFMVMTQEDAKEMASEVTNTMTILVAALAAISLIVGGIGIMNIMLVSVNERIREIGLRMAIGARQGDIMLQFLVESIVLSITGGLVGILLGILFSTIAITAMKMPQYISWEAAVVSILFSAAIGTGFGFYPALKASKLDPIVALRNE